MTKKLILDANESRYFSRQLTQVESEIYEIEYPELKGRSIIPVMGNWNEGAESIGYRQTDKVGQAKIVAHNGDDLPRVDIFGNEYLRPVKTVGDSFGYSIMDIKNAAMAGIPLQSEKGQTAREAAEIKIDEVAAIGSPDDGIATGFFNDANVAVNAATGVWTGLTVAQILTDVKASYNRIVTDTLGMIRPNTMILPDDAYSHIAMTQLGTTSDTTILEWLLAKTPDLNDIIPWYRAETAGAAGVGRMVMYKRDPRAVSQAIPMEFMMLPPQARGLEFIVPCMARTAGATIKKPKGMDYVDGV